MTPRQHLRADAGGSIEIYIQKDLPGAGKESNWLPAPDDKFILMLRMYWPNENDLSILNGTWTVPPVRKASTAPGGKRRLCRLARDELRPISPRSRVQLTSGSTQLLGVLFKKAARLRDSLPSLPAEDPKLTVFFGRKRIGQDKRR
jgi:hypothetical protein